MLGVGDIWRGAGFLFTHPRLWPWAAIPFIINVFLFFGLFWLANFFLGEWFETAWFQREVWWMEVLRLLLVVLLNLIAALIAVFAFVPLATVVAAPFNDYISDQVERMYAGVGVDEDFSLKLLWRGIVVGTASSLILMLKTLGLLALTIPLYLIPLIGAVLASIAGTLITIRFLSLEYTSYSMDRRYWKYRQKDEFLKRNRWRTVGMGAMAFVIMLLPVVNALFIPISAIAGTLLFCDAAPGVAQPPEFAPAEQ